MSYGDANIVSARAETVNNWCWFSVCIYKVNTCMVYQPDTVKYLYTLLSKVNIQQYVHEWVTKTVVVQSNGIYNIKQQVYGYVYLISVLKGC